MSLQVGLFPAEVRDNVQVLVEAARSYRDDPDFRARIESEPRAALADLGVEIEPSELGVQVCANTEEVFHVVMPVDPNTAVRDEDMRVVVGGTTVSTAGSATTASTVGCVPSTISSASSASTAGSAGSVQQN